MGGIKQILIMRRDYLNNNNKINIGIVGGGSDSSIGPAHRIALRMDGRYNLSAGVFSKNLSKSKKIAKKLGISVDRAYKDYKEMAKKEKLRNDGISVVSVITPPSSHYEICKKFLDLNYNIICDKPLVPTIKQGKNLRLIAKTKNIPFCVTYNYTGYPLVREAKELIKNKLLGNILNINIEYLQGHIVGLNKKSIKKALGWRSKNSCDSLVLSEIGTHAFHMAEFVTGLKVTKVYADIKTNFVKNVDDNANVLLRFERNIQGFLWVSFSTAGGESGLKFRINGAKGTIEWLQDNPNEMKLNLQNKPLQIITRGSSFVGKKASEASRISKGHPEGYFEAFANIYSEYADFIQQKNPKFISRSNTFPTIDDGIRGIKFIQAAKKSNKLKKWVNI